jgi:hypothetical protein
MLMGPRTGVAVVELSPELLNTPFPIDTVAKSRAGVAAQLQFTEIHTCGALNGADFYRVRALGAKDAFLEIENSCGAANCTAFPRLMLNEDYLQRRIQKVCAFFEN